jgi:hypothetical protein
MTSAATFPCLRRRVCLLKIEAAEMAGDIHHFADEKQAATFRLSIIFRAIPTALYRKQGRTYRGCAGSTPTRFRHALDFGTLHTLCAFI